MFLFFGGGGDCSSYFRCWQFPIACMRQCPASSKATSDRGDPLLQFVMPRLVQTQGIYYLDVTDEDCDKVVNNITDCDFFCRKPPKTAITQWNTLNDNLEVLLPEWWHKLVPLLHLGIMQGWVACGKSTALLESLKPVDLAAIKECVLKKESTQVSHAKVKRMRDGCPGVIKMATFAMLDPSFRIDLELIVFATKEWRYFHGALQKSLVSSAGALEFHLGMVNGQGVFWKALRASMSPFQKLNRLQRMTFVVSIGDMPYEQTALDSPEMQNQGRLAIDLWRLFFGEIDGFVRNFIHYCCSVHRPTGVGTSPTWCATSGRSRPLRAFHGRC